VSLPIPIHSLASAPLQSLIRQLSLTVASEEDTIIRESKRLTIERFIADEPPQSASDTLTIEEPLEIRVRFRRGPNVVQKPVSVTMRTPGSDRELAAGFLFTEGIVHEASWIDAIEVKSDNENSVLITLSHEVDLKRLERHFYTSSSCGICGKTSIEALAINREISLYHRLPQVDPETVLTFPERLLRQQAHFSKTGGLHAAALIDPDGTIRAIREDVGRHNAVDKVIGHALLTQTINFSNSILMVSGRAGFELVQKAIMAGIPIMTAVGAPSSLAVELARQYDLTLIGFLRGNRFNLYSGRQRMKSLEATAAAEFATG
ncbi:MAG TPA: formate dehydrogenase accessory sulfurtransferase FdhD, partial [Chthoniobacterales bacterium]|nr:formate dehydrogenase accessory sulfurtransferase FdhD [Chthoniobacterales bacterium]